MPLRGIEPRTFCLQCVLGIQDTLGIQGFLGLQDTLGIIYYYKTDALPLS